MRLAEGAIGEIGELPDDAASAVLPVTTRMMSVDENGTTSGLPRASSLRLSATAQQLEQQAAAAAAAQPGTPRAGSPSAADGEAGPSGRSLKFIDKDEHVYFWFPLLAGLSELTFDPRWALGAGLRCC
jgi:hypothetical protein